MSGIVFSVVIPTYNRLGLLRGGIESIVAAQRPWPCEIVVVDDGSADGTYEAIRAMRLPLPVKAVRQPNAGAAAARNSGAGAARGRYLLFLDDDMTADERLLVEHERSLAGGADAVVGDIPMHPDLPRTALTRGVARWTRLRRQRLQGGPEQLTVADFLTGQLSVKASCFAAIQGFDERLTAGGSFGGEDTDFLFRLRQADVRLVYNGAAVSYQRYVTTPEQNVKQWWEAGRNDAVLSRKHPTLGPILWAQHRGGTIAGRITRTAAKLPEPLLKPIQSAITRRVGAGRMDLATEYAYARMRDVSYWDGARTGGGIVRNGRPDLQILAYHAVDTINDPRVGRWTVDPDTFARQINTLRDGGFTFVGADRLLEHLDTGLPLPDRSLLLTFDDGYESLLRYAAPILAKHGIPAVVCVVTGQLGGHNAWDVDAGAVQLPLLSAAQLHQLRDAGWEIAAHTHSHAHLAALPSAALRDEVTRPRAALTAHGLPTPRLLAYPHGEQDFRVRAYVKRAGYTAGLSMTIGGDRYALPRQEIRAGMSAEDVLELLNGPARPAQHDLGRELKAAVRLAMDGVPRQRRASGRRETEQGVRT